MRRILPTSPTANLLVAGICTLGSVGFVEAYPDTLPVRMAEAPMEALCHKFDRQCPWEDVPSTVQEGLEGGEVKVNTTVLYGLKAVTARFKMDRELPFTDAVIDTAAASEHGTVGFEASVKGLVTVTPRFAGTASALVVPGGEAGAPIDISSFTIDALQPYRAGPDGTCPKLDPWKVDPGCMDGRIDSGAFDGTPLLGANNESDVVTKVAQVGHIYEEDESCIYDQILIPTMTKVAADILGITLDLSGPTRFTKVATIATIGALRQEFPQLGEPQRILVPMVGEVPQPTSIEEAFASLSDSTNNAISLPDNFDPNYCADKTLLSQEQMDSLQEAITRLTVYGLAPDHFNAHTMKYEYNNDALVAPNSEERKALGLPS